MYLQHQLCQSVHLKKRRVDDMPTIVPIGTETCDELIILVKKRKRSKTVCKKCQYSNSNLLSFIVSHLGHTTTGLINTFLNECTHIMHSNPHFQAKIPISLIFKCFANMGCVMCTVKNWKMKIVNRRTSLMFTLCVVCDLLDGWHVMWPIFHTPDSVEKSRAHRAFHLFNNSCHWTYLVWWY